MSRRQLLAPVALTVATVVAAVVAALIGRPVWAAVLGAGLVLAYWSLEVVAWRRGEATGTLGAAIRVALAGMVLRIALVVGVLVVVGLTSSRPTIATATLSFLAAFSLYLPLRLVTYTALQAPRQAGAQ
jgi:hypothetical protein